MKYLNEEIINLSNKLGFELIGFCKLDYFEELESILLKQESLKYKTSFQVWENDIKTFKNKSIYKSAVVVALTYNKFTPNIKENEVYFSSCAVGEDYHTILKNKLEFISSYLKDLGYNTFIGVDNNMYDERYLAYQAGLGYYGKNNLLINDKYGSLFFIGILLTDALFSYSKPINKTCQGCNKCIECCPTGAINKSGLLNGNICLSYLTQKKKLDSSEEKYLNNCVYGCDICTNVCPHNKNVKTSNNFLKSGIELIEANKFLNMDNFEYRKFYKNNSSYWRGKEVIDRNIHIYMQNKLKMINKHDKM